MEFEFDQAKSQANKEKHGISLEEAQAIWEEFYVQASARPTDEPRWMVIGRIGSRLYACVYTYRGETVRLISCRRARDKEAQLYYDYLKEKISKG